MPKSPPSPPYDDPTEPLTMDEVKERVAAVLGMDPAGVSGRHRKAKDEALAATGE
jgi:hypothetical protein